MKQRACIGTIAGLLAAGVMISILTLSGCTGEVGDAALVNLLVQSFEEALTCFSTVLRFELLPFFGLGGVQKGDDHFRVEA